MPSRVKCALHLFAAAALLVGSAFTSRVEAQSTTSVRSDATTAIRVAPESDPARASIDALLREGTKLEASRRWGDALTHYEDALKTHRNHAKLRERATVVKIHFNLVRRYTDRSFRGMLDKLSYNDAIALYDEVLRKVETHYVHNPSWRRIAAYGADNVDVAVTDKAFIDAHLHDVSSDRIAGFRQQLRRHLAAQQVRSRRDAVQAAADIAELAHRWLGVSRTAAVLEYACGASGRLDDYSSYLTSGQLTDVYSQIDGNFVGLGVELKADGDSLLIVDVITGSPAAKSGIRANDRVLEVDGRTTKGLTTDEAADLLQGPEGSAADMLVATGGESPRRLRVIRQHVDVPSIDKVKIIDSGSGVAYLKLAVFQKTTSRDLDAALWKLHRQGMKSLIIDLRGNPGGLLTAAVEIVDKFVSSGAIVSTKGRNPSEDYTYSAHRVGTWSVPLVVLIDGDSASASEIFAAAIRDHRRGTIVGEQSYGKGSVQGIFPLQHAGCGIRLTTAKFYSPSGGPISKVGVKPDVTVRTVAKPTESSRRGERKDSDAILSAAVELSRKHAGRG
ncbi:MAG: S41 family peptidase [Pirellulales bacterium]|nr:S41 family peptidase [Pirellulales bacterium]